MERFACPRPDRRGRFRCIDDRALCDGFYDCPDEEDENPEVNGRYNQYELIPVGEEIAVRLAACQNPLLEEVLPFAYLTTLQA